MTEEKKTEEPEETKILEQFVGRDLRESYVYYCNYVPRNPSERYNILVKSVTFGMELLPHYDTLDETDKEKKEINKKKQERIDKLYETARLALISAIPAKREINYDYVDIGGERIKLYKIKATDSKDAKSCQALKEELTTVLDNFTTQQHEQHIPALQAAHNKILHELAQKNIIPSINPTFDQMIKEKIKTLHRGITEQLEQKGG